MNTPRLHGFVLLSIVVFCLGCTQPATDDNVEEEPSSMIEGGWTSPTTAPVAPKQPPSETQTPTPTVSGVVSQPTTTLPFTTTTWPVVTSTLDSRTCTQLGGYECVIGDECPGSWLEAADTFNCCSTRCEEVEMLEIEPFQTDPDDTTGRIS